MVSSGNSTKIKKKDMPMCSIKILTKSSRISFPICLILSSFKIKKAHQKSLSQTIKIQKKPKRKQKKKRKKYLIMIGNKEKYTQAILFL